MGIFNIRTETKIKIVKVLGTDREIDGVTLSISRQQEDGGYPIGDPFTREVDLHFGEEIIA